MATRTPNIGLAKPVLSDVVSPSQFNENSDILDELVSGLLTDMTEAQADILRLKSGYAIADVVTKVTKEWLEEHGATTCYIEGHTFHVGG